MTFMHNQRLYPGSMKNDNRKRKKKTIELNDDTGAAFKS